MLQFFSSDPLAVGSAAPDFALKDEAGKMWRLGDLRGKNVMLVFYPADATPG